MGMTSVQSERRFYTSEGTYWLWVSSLGVNWILVSKRKESEMIRKALMICVSLVLMTACTPNDAGRDGTATQDALNNAATQTAAAFTSATPPIVTPTSLGGETTVPIETVSPTPAPPQGTAQFLAYVSNGQLVVSDVTNGVLGGTTQYTVAGESDQVSDLVWSPSGEFVAFVSQAGGEPHVFYIFALGQSSPTDLGPGSAPAWSPDSQSLAYIGGTFPNENIWVTTIENPAPRQLTFESNFTWDARCILPTESL